MQNKNISTFVNSFVPDFIEREHPEFVVFLKNYLKYIERYNDVKMFVISRIEGAEYDAEENGTIYQGNYLIADYTEEQLPLLKSLKGTLIKGVTSNAIYKVDDVVYSSKDSKWVLKAKATSKKKLFNLGETVAQVDIGEYTQIANLLLFRDINETLDEFIQLHADEYLTAIPSNLTSNPKVLIKNIRDYYRAKGTEQSFRFLFRAIWGSEIEFYYPKIDILRVSDGKWYQPYKIDLVDPTNITDFDNLSIVGSNSGTRADVEKIIYDFTDPQNPLKFLEVTVQEGELIDGEEISSIDGLVSGTISTITKMEGRWLNDDGKLSSTKVLQDNFFYQDFSYVIQTDIGINVFEEVIRQVNHPSGLKLFGQFVGGGETLLTINLATLDSLYTLVSFDDPMSVDLTLLNHAVITAIYDSEFFDYTYRKYDERKEIHPNDILFHEIGQFDSVNLNPFEDVPDEANYLVPDSKLIVET